MKSLGCAGQFNLRGKKFKTAYCGCCVVQNFKEDYQKKLDEKEIRETDESCLKPLD